MTVIRARQGTKVFSLEYIQSKLGSMPVPFSSYAGMYLRVNAGGTATEWAAVGGGLESDPVFTSWLAGPPDLSEFNDDVGFLTSITGGMVTTALGYTPYDSSNPAAYLSAVSVDGVTITGDGTPGNPLVSVAAGGFITSVSNTNTVKLTEAAGDLTAVVVYQDSVTIDLSDDGAGLKAELISLSGFDTADLSEGTNLYFTTARVLSTVLTGLSITGAAVVSTDTVLQAFGKLQNQINSVAGAMNYQGTWNATTNSPALVTSTGTKGYVYRVTVAGATNLDGITDWKVGDFVVFNGATWDKWDATDAITSVNGYTSGAVTLTTADVADSLNKRYVTDAQLVVIGNTSGTNSGNQTTIVGITGTKAQYDTSCTDGNFLYVGDVTQYTDELAQDAIGAMVDSTIIYTDATPLLSRAALTGDVIASTGSNATTIVTASKSFTWTGTVTDTTSSGSLDDYTMAGLVDATELRFNVGAVSVIFRGIQGGTDGRLLRVVNEGASTTFVISNNAGTSSAANRILCHATISLAQYDSVLLKYDGSVSLWLVISKHFNYTSASDLTGNDVAPTIKNLAITNAKVNDVAESKVTFTNITTGNVTSTAHGYAPISPADATLFLNGAATPAYTFPAATTFLSITGDQTSSSTGLADVAGLAAFSTVAGKTYYFCFELMVTTSATTVGIKCTVNHSTAITSLNAVTVFPISATTFSTERISALDGGTVPANGPGATLQPYYISGTVVINTAGTFALRFASETGGAVVVKAGSYGYITRLN